MRLKGIELPVNSVIIIALAIFVLLMIAAFFSKSSGELDRTQINSAFNQGCSLLASAYNCDQERMQDIKTSLVLNGQAQNLLQVCKISFNDQTKSALKCKFACQTCQKYVYEGSPCEEPADCISPLTSNWKCCFGTVKTEDSGRTCDSTGVKQGFCYSPDVIPGEIIIRGK